MFTIRSTTHEVSLWPLGKHELPDTFGFNISTLLAFTIVYFVYKLSNFNGYFDIKN